MALRLIWICPVCLRMKCTIGRTRHGRPVVCLHWGTAFVHSPKALMTERNGHAHQPQPH